MIKIRKRVYAAAVGCALTAITVLAIPARADTVINDGQMCIANSEGKDFCMNLLNGQETFGNSIQMWQAGVPENNWEQVKIGNVTDNPPGTDSGGWPFTGNASVFNHLLRGNDVSFLEYMGPQNFPQNWCAEQTTWDQSNQLGHVQLEPCGRNPRFVYASNGPFMVPVWATNTSSELLQLGAEGLVNGHGVFSCQVCWGQWHWIPRV